MRCGVLHVTCPGLMHVQRPGRRVAGCGSHRRSADGRWLVLWACDGGLKFLPCACAFDGFLLWFLLVSTGLPLRLFETDAEANCIHEFGGTALNGTVQSFKAMFTLDVLCL